MPLIGAHVSASISLDKSLDRAQNIGAECTQIFISPPQQWIQTDHPQEEIDAYLNKVKTTNISKNFIHATYLINLAAQDPEHLKKSTEWLEYALKLAEKLGITGVIFHCGSHKGQGTDSYLNQISQAIVQILKDAPDGPDLILENCAGSGGVIGSFSDLGKILKAVGDDRLKICLDTQHAFAYGFDLSSINGLEELISSFDKEIGWDNLIAVHANDSKVPVGGLKDRHENIGEGFIGREGFKNILNHPGFKKLAIILEVPGFAGTGPDMENIDILHSLMSTID